MALVMALAILTVSWPESTRDRVFYGEPWGDILAEGFIWGEQRGEYDSVSFNPREVPVTLTNVSSVWLLDPHEQINLTVECHNRSLTIISTPGEFGYIDGFWRDVDFFCVYGGFNGTAVLDEDDEYHPEYNVSWLEGRAIVIHNDSLKYSMDYDIEIWDCIVIIDGVTYSNMNGLDVAVGDVAELSVRGRGSVNYEGPMFPHINGTLRIEDFLRIEGDKQDTYRALVVKGDDITLRTVDTPASGSGAFFGFFKQWKVEVAVSSDATVEIVEPLKLPIYAELVVIAIIAVMVIGILMSLRKLVIGTTSGSSNGVVEGNRPSDPRL